MCSPRFSFLFSCLIFKMIFFVLFFVVVASVGAFHVARGFLWRLSRLDVGRVWDACAVSRGDGAGTLTEANGDKYVGDWKDDQKHSWGMSCARGDES